MTEALNAWEAERRRLADEFRPHKDRPTEPEAWTRYFAGTKAAWRAFAAAEPEMAAQMFADNMLTVSRLSAKYSRTSRSGQ